MEGVELEAYDLTKGTLNLEKVVSTKYPDLKLTVNSIEALKGNVVQIIYSFERNLPKYARLPSYREIMSENDGPFGMYNGITGQKPTTSHLAEDTESMLAEVFRNGFARKLPDYVGLRNVHAIDVEIKPEDLEVKSIRSEPEPLGYILNNEYGFRVGSLQVIGQGSAYLKIPRPIKQQGDQSLVLEK